MFFRMVGPVDPVRGNAAVQCQLFDRMDDLTSVHDQIHLVGRPVAYRIH